MINIMMYFEETLPNSLLDMIITRDYILLRWEVPMLFLRQFPVIEDYFDVTEMSLGNSRPPWLIFLQLLT